jgi:hypothetical protein
MLGGLLGKGSKDDDDTQQEQVRVLQAIERAQVSTIDSINNQTNELLNPGSRLINLPTSFSVPEFNPGGNIQLNFDFSGASINTQGDMQDMTNAIESAVVAGLSRSRRINSRTTRR